MANTEFEELFKAATTIINIREVGEMKLKYSNAMA